jgi:large subunit ribosomal protein L19
MIDLEKIIPDQIRTDMPKFNSGDHIRVQVRVIEGDKERLQSFEGDVISVRGAGASKSFTVRKIANIEVLKEGDVRKAKLFYLRSLSGKAARIKGKKA